MATSNPTAGAFRGQAAPIERRFSLSDLWSAIRARLRARAEARHSSHVARFIAGRGGVLTDELEREISRRFGRLVE